MSAPDFAPPARFDGATFESYEPQNASQQEALQDARTFAERVRRRYTGPFWRRWFPDDDLRHGLYLVGPVGTGKTHLLVSIYRAVQPDVPAAFLHSSALFRATAHPEDYARALARRSRLLLLDEVELDDPANEVRLLLVLKTLGTLGVTVAATSNAEPEKFLSAQFGRDRLERFISEEFRQTYHVVFVGGEDYRRRLQKPGKAWIGPADSAAAAMQQQHEQDARPKRWLTRADLLRLTTDVERGRLAADLGGLGSLYLEGLGVDSADDALRLLRVVDDLYGQPQPPVLYFTAERLPERWFPPEAAHAGLEQGVAEKFARTVSRLHALCAIERAGAAVEDEA
ncbi:MAG: AFG1/ZapE family ATPase [Rhodothermales bacterium]|nr:AFG1/ZapE family ATPase [Rhodothermales bacterium]